MSPNALLNFVDKTKQPEYCSHDNAVCRAAQFMHMARHKQLTFDKSVQDCTLLYKTFRQLYVPVQWSTNDS